MSTKKFSESDAKAWCDNLIKLEEVASLLVSSGMWALMVAEQFRTSVGGNVIQISDRARRIGNVPKPPKGFVNFKKLGTELDELCKKANTLLPEQEN